jgi:hypothetical protein
MPKAPPKPDRLPSMEHNGTIVEIYQHHGYSIPDRGPAPASRILYAARDCNNERHWRASLHEMTALIDRNFGAAPLASGVS